MEKYKEIKIDATITPKVILEQLLRRGEVQIKSTQDKKSNDGEDANTKK